jgi:GNAT superfamily N-acetyltransferase
MAGPDPSVRCAGPSDRAAILALAARSLGWSGDERDRAFFAWKHERNPFGASPAWVATLDGQVVGFRTFLRWELRGAGGASLRLVRAVDTATDPDHQGRGVFRTLTLGAVDALRNDGVDAVFNTPNDRSRPGYLKMGWSQLGRPTLGAQPRGPVGGLRMLRPRAAAEKWSEPTDVGTAAVEALGGGDLDGLLHSLPHHEGWATSRTAAFLRWRYGFEPLHYRAVEVRAGMAIFRVRRRGPNREVAICEWLAPGPDPRAVRRLTARAGDYALGVGLGLRHGMVPLPRQGPILTWRPLARPEVPALGELRFSLGDLELF